MKTLLRRIFQCWLLDRHWTSVAHGYAPAQWAHCSGCGKLLYGPHEIERDADNIPLHPSERTGLR